MKIWKYVLTIWIGGLVSIQHLAAQTHAPASTTLFDSQRHKLNSLLEERNKRFGAYNQSLEQKNGIFGLYRTGSDMQKSIDILKQIVLYDNEIFVETKTLLKLKDSEREYYQSLAASYDQQINSYISTISRLQNENEKLHQTAMASQQYSKKNNIFIGLALVLAVVPGIAFFGYIRKNRVPQRNAG